nr:MAG TPA: hypothetical protein [Caudoviricetes sp.]
MMQRYNPLIPPRRFHGAVFYQFISIENNLHQSWLSLP